MQLTRRTRQPHGEQGASSVEYALLVAMIAAVIVTAVLALGGSVQGLFSDTCDTYQTNSGQTGTDCDG
jgi:Flp pilus assembly pilin Flp